MRSEGQVHWQFKVKAKLAPFCGGRAQKENAGPGNPDRRRLLQPYFS
jgi:hypothetical protein